MIWLRLRWDESPIPLLAVFAALAGLVALFEVTALTRVDPVRVVQVGGGEDAMPERQDVVAVTADDPAVVAALEKAKGGNAAEARKDLEALVKATPGSVAAHAALGSLLLRAGEVAAAEASFSAAVALAPLDGTLQFDRAVALERGGKPQEAEVSYVEAIRLAPGLFGAWFNLGELRLEAGNAASAAEAFRTAVPLAAAGPARSKTFTRLGVALRKADRPAEAVTAFQDAIVFRPSNVEARIGLVRALLDQRDLVRAREEVGRVLALDPSHASAHWLKGQIADREGAREEARAEWAEAVRLRPSSVEMRFALARVELSLGNPGAARTLLEALDREHPGDAEVLFQLGRVAYREERWPEAVARYRAAIDARKTPAPETWLNLGLALRSAGDRTAAREAYRKALESRPGYAEAMFGLGMLDLSSDPESADGWFAKAVAADPAYAEAWFNRGILASRAKKPLDAEAAYRKALAIRPEYADARLNLAALLSRAKRWDAAVEENRAVLRLQPGNAKAWFNLGRAWSGAGKTDEAERAYRRAIALDPDYGAAWVNLGVVLADRGEPQRAIDVYREALDREAGNARLRYNLALQYRKVGDLAAAEQELRRATRLDPGYAKAWKVLADVVETSHGADAAASVKAAAEAALASNPRSPETETTDGT